MIVKMKFVSITGPTDDIDRVINTYLSKYEIHLENAMLEHGSVQNLRPYVDANPYKAMLADATELMNHITRVPVKNATAMNVDASYHHVQKIMSQMNRLNMQKEGLLSKRAHYTESMEKIRPFMELRYDMSSILGFQHIKYRFGRIHKENWKRLEEFGSDDITSIFTKCTTDEEYVWGVYFVAEDEADKVDAIYTSLHFERTFVPSESRGTPEEACEYLTGEIAKLDEKLQIVENNIAKCLDDEKERITMAYDRIKAAYENFDVRKVAARTTNDGNDFYIVCGWMAKDDAEAFSKELENDDMVVCLVEDAPKDSKKQPPTKLKNPRIFRPFEMFIRMYGLPAYNEIDPTIIVALTYAFIFGVMFGDVGQGLCLVVGGFIVSKVKKSSLAAIISCAGIFSTFFGFMFGSIFGFEDIIDAVWMRPGIKMTALPLVGRLNTVFVIAIAFGMGLVLFTMLLHIINGIKSHDIGSVLFDTNGIAGMIFYGAVITVVTLFMSGHTLPAAIVLIVMFVVPLLLIAAKEPLTHLIEKKSKIFEDGVGMFLVQSVFELIEVLLSYFSNTLSFVRIGAFAVSHAAMMEVVLMLAGAEKGSPNILVVVLGNIFVMGMEGLIVGIQVLRLEYYEMFSRFYKGNGREFKPFKNK